MATPFSVENVDLSLPFPLPPDGRVILILETNSICLQALAQTIGRCPIRGLPGRLALGDEVVDFGSRKVSPASGPAHLDMVFYRPLQNAQNVPANIAHIRCRGYYRRPEGPPADGNRAVERPVEFPNGCEHLHHTTGKIAIRCHASAKPLPKKASLRGGRGSVPQDHLQTSDHSMEAFVLGRGCLQGVFRKRKIASIVP